MQVGDKVSTKKNRIGIIQSISKDTVDLKFCGEKKTQYGTYNKEDITLVVESTAKKDDKDKPDLSLIHPSLVNAAARALMFGANKYGRNNYKKGLDINRVYAALLRHTMARMAGEIKDPESGLDHLDHMAANIQMLCFYSDKNEK